MTVPGKRRGAPVDLLNDPVRIALRMAQAEREAFLARYMPRRVGPVQRLIRSLGLRATDFRGDDVAGGLS